MKINTNLLAYTVIAGTIILGGAGISSYVKMTNSYRSHPEVFEYIEKSERLSDMEEGVEREALKNRIEMLLIISKQQ